MAISKVTICGLSTSNLPVLSQKEKEELFTLIDKGDEAAREEFIRGNLRLVLSIVQRFAGSGENPDDLFQVGCIGLIKAVDNFDTSLGLRFSTYAVPLIIGEVRRFLRDNSALRVSRSLRDIAYKAIYTRDVLTKRNDKEPTIEDISSETGISKEEILIALDAISTPLSLYEPIYKEGVDELCIMDQLSDKKNKEDSWIETITLNDAMQLLSEKEKEIIKLRFYEGKTQTEVAEEINISQAQVSRLEKNALRLMRAYLR